MINKEERPVEDLYPKRKRLFYHGSRMHCHYSIVVPTCSMHTSHLRIMLNNSEPVIDGTVVSRPTRRRKKVHAPPRAPDHAWMTVLCSCSRYLSRGPWRGARAIVWPLRQPGQPWPWLPCRIAASFMKCNDKKGTKRPQRYLNQARQVKKRTLSSCSVARPHSSMYRCNPRIGS